MSRIGKVPIEIPEDVKTTISGNSVKVKGPKGEMSVTCSDRVKVGQQESAIVVERLADDRQSRADHGLYQRLISNMVFGVKNGYKKELEIVGVGYRADIQGKDLVLQVGMSHQPHYPILEGLNISLPKPTHIVIEGADKQKVGQAAAEIRKLRPPEPYRGKGIRYMNEQIRRKVGKAGAK